MLTARQEIARERRRMMQVRRAFAAGLESSGLPAPGRAAFYLACADYLHWSMARLHRQDQRIHDLVRERIAADDDAGRERLAALDRQQERSRALADDLHRAAQLLRNAGETGVPAFEAAARDYAAAFAKLVVPGRNPLFEYTDRLLTDADWQEIAGVTPQIIAEEESLFGSVQAAAPPGMDPAQCSGEHRPG